MNRTKSGGDAMIRLDGVGKRYPDGTVAVAELDLSVAPGEIAMLIGPSGCGKTTTMRMINRLVEPTSGRIFIDGDDVTTIDAVQLRRRIGYVIQQVGLFPHLSVAANIATVPKLLGWDRARCEARSKELLELVGLDPGRFAKRYPHELSGGQRQRVGVARALAADPPVLLMDEPFGAVDPIARERLQDEFLRLQETVRKTIVFVTHDVDEAIKLGDKIAVMREGGHLEQYADPATIMSSPANDFVADFVGAEQTLRRLKVSIIDPASLQQWPTVDSSSALAEAGRRINGSPGLVVTDSNRVLGVVPRAATAGPGTAGQAAETVAIIDIREPVESALAALLATPATAGTPSVVIVTDDGSYAGVLTTEALLTNARSKS